MRLLRIDSTKAGGNRIGGCRVVTDVGRSVDFARRKWELYHATGWHSISFADIRLVIGAGGRCTSGLSAEITLAMIRYVLRKLVGVILFSRFFDFEHHRELDQYVEERYDLDGSKLLAHNGYSQCKKGALELVGRRGNRFRCLGDRLGGAQVISREREMESV